MIESETNEGGPPSTAHGVAAPVTEKDRIQVLDVLRGIAILGIFMVNIGFFSMSVMKLMDPARLADAATGTIVAHGIVKVFFEYKFVSLFSFLFGAGMILQMQRAEAKHAPFTSVYLRRTFLLMLIGAIHAWLIWYGDILFIYSWVALMVFFMRHAPAKMMLVISSVLLLLGFALTLGFLALNTAALMQVQNDAEQAPQAIVEPADENATSSVEVIVPDGEQTTLDQIFEAFQAMGQQNNEPWIELETDIYTNGGFGDALLIRTVSWLLMVVFSVLFSGFGIRILGMFLLGAAFMKLDFHRKERRSWHVRMVVVGLTLGLTGELGGFLWIRAEDFEMGWTMVAVESIHYLSSFFLCLGYIGGVCLLVHGGIMKPVLNGIACVGRTALTNYLLQSVVATGIMYWWGLRYFGTVDRPTQLLMVVGIYIGQVFLSILWLRAFRMGPMEWLWRSATLAASAVAPLGILLIHPTHLSTSHALVLSLMQPRRACCADPLFFRHDAYRHMHSAGMRGRGMLSTSLTALCTDFYVNQKLALKMDLPSNRESVLDLFDRIKRELPDMDRFRRYENELAPESPEEHAEYSWMAIKATSIRSGWVNPDELHRAYRLHQLILETAPYFLSVTPLDVDYLELVFGFDMEAQANRNEIVFDALLADSPFASLIDFEHEHVLDAQPFLGFALTKKSDLQAFVEIKSRTRPNEIAHAHFDREPISVYLTIRQHGPLKSIPDFATTFARLAGHAERLSEDRVIPHIIAPIRETILSRPS